MSKLHFMNKGTFDPTAMLTFGVSAKDSSDAIGYFGTGFKYAVAIILRLGGTIKVDSCGEKYVFASKEEIIRGKSFDIVTMNGDNAGFTTHLGARWEPWQAFRELYSNTLDEGGTVAQRRSKGFDTVITVDCQEITNAYIDRDHYFLKGEPIYADDRVEIYHKPGMYHYFKGIAVNDTNDTAFTFNILHGVDLTEDRTAKYPSYDITGPIAASIQSCEDESVIHKLLISRCSSEQHIPYNSGLPTTEAFLGTCREILNTDSATLPECARTVLFKHDNKPGGWPEIEMSDLDGQRMGRSLALLRQIGVPADEFPIKIVSGLGTGCMGRAHEGGIYLSKLPFEMGTKQVASTLLEEWVHIKHGHCDFDRGMQSWLFDKIISLGEEQEGIPL